MAVVPKLTSFGMFIIILPLLFLLFIRVPHTVEGMDQGQGVRNIGSMTAVLGKRFSNSTNDTKVGLN